MAISKLAIKMNKCSAPIYYRCSRIRGVILTKTAQATSKVTTSNNSCLIWDRLSAGTPTNLKNQRDKTATSPCSPN